jgi:hypothetical protein
MNNSKSGHFYEKRTNTATGWKFKFVFFMETTH